jgi:hypothetical protein
MLREQFVAEVRTALERNGYFADDFDLHQKRQGEYVVLKLRYRFHAGFELTAQIRIVAPGPLSMEVDEKVGTVNIEASPGDYLQREETTVHDKDELLDYLHEWVARIAAELEAIPVNRRLDEQRKLIEELASQFSEESAGYYTAAEATELRARLDEFEKRLTESIKASAKNKKEAGARISELHQQVELLKTQVEVLQKRHWTKSAVIRLAGWLRDPLNRQMLESGTDLAKSLLLPAGDKHP